MTDEPWYAELRERWRPPAVRVLLIGESAPDPGGGDRRCFYAPTMTGADNLYRGVIEAFYGRPPGRAGDAKAPWLKRLQDDGVFLIDLCPMPVNRLPSRERRLALREHAPALVARARALGPEGVIVCHGPTFKAAPSRCGRPVSRCCMTPRFPSRWATGARSSSSPSVKP